MTKPPIRVLIVDDDEIDQLACRRAFASEPQRFTLALAGDGQQGLDIARQNELDCILLDYHLPDVTGLEFLAHMAVAGISVPVIMLTGADSAAVAAESMRRGACDYVVKDMERRYLSYLPSVIERALREQRLVLEKRQLEAKFRTLVEQIPAITYIAAIDSGALTYISPQIGMLGFSPEEWLGAPQLQARQIHADDRAQALAAIGASRAAGTTLCHEYRLASRDGQLRWFRDEAQAVLDEKGTQLFMQGILVDITPNKEAEQAMQASREAARKLVAHQENIKEQERKRIAQEIHDELGGLLTGIKAHIAVSVERTVAAGGAPDPLLVEANALAGNAIETVRKVITALRPSVLDQLGVWAAVEWYADQVAHRSGLVCHFSMAPELAHIELDGDRSTALFRIVQEALTNVERHAKASEASVQLALDGRTLVASVRDNGCGIETERLRGGQSWGILGMHERSRHLGGDLRISGSAGQGTTLVWRLPLERPDVE